MSLRNKLGYFVDAALKQWTMVKCPNCGETRSKQVDRKWFVTSLHECTKCHLLFRHPPQTIASNLEFYQSEYKQNDGITTDLPTDVELSRFTKGDFEHLGEKNATRIVRLLESLTGKSSIRSKVIDYGCSWGYISYQLVQNGFDVQGFEISKPRASFGVEKLQLDIETDETYLRRENDFFLSSHVIEHVPSPSDMLRKAAELVVPSGFVITICPNGSEAFRERDPVSFHKLWGQVHPNFLTDLYFKSIAGSNPYFLTTTQKGWEAIAEWDQRSSLVHGDLSDSEILFVWRI